MSASPAVVPESLFLDAKETGPRSIPKIKFIEDVASFSKDHDISSVIRTLQQLHSKYQFMDRSLSSQKESLLNKLPGIQEAIESVTLIKTNKTAPLKTHFVLSENFYCKGEVQPLEHVFLWLGANVLMEYPVDEAIAMLHANRKSAEVALADLASGLEFLRTQITTTEVNIARFHNHGVVLRKQAQPSS